MTAKTKSTYTMQLHKVLFLTVIISLVLGDKSSEYGSYVNPNPRPYLKCSAPDLIKLSSCCNDVLSRLDECRAGDLACECCALQNMDQECLNICPDNPSNNFLTVIDNDCKELNDINSCSLPFKKVDGEPKEFKKWKLKVENQKNEDGVEDLSSNSVVVKSKLSPQIPDQKAILDILQQEEDDEVNEVEAISKEPEPMNGIKRIELNETKPLVNATVTLKGFKLSIPWKKLASVSTMLFSYII